MQSGSLRRRLVASWSCSRRSGMCGAVRRGRCSTRTSRASRLSGWSSRRSATGTLNWCCAIRRPSDQLPARGRSGPEKGELQWRRPTPEALQIMLHNPIYAGYYGYGRARSRDGAIPGRRRRAGWCMGVMSGWSRCPAGCRLHQRRAVPGERGGDGRDPHIVEHPARCVAARRCWRGCCAAGRAGAPHDSALPRHRSLTPRTATPARSCR